jgi:hypothetical protein
MLSELIVKREQAKLAIIDLIEDGPIPIKIEGFGTPSSIDFVMHLEAAPERYLQLVRGMASLGLDLFLENYRRSGANWYFAVTVETFDWKPEPPAA